MELRISFIPGMVDDFSLVHVHFVFCLLNFIVDFPYLRKYYHILFVNIVFKLHGDGPSDFFHAIFTSFHTHASLLTFFVCFFILFHSCCSSAHVFGKTLLHEFHISYI